MKQGAQGHPVISFYYSIYYTFFYLLLDICYIYEHNRQQGFSPGALLGTKETEPCPQGA